MESINTIRSFEDLDVWKKSVDFSISVFNYVGNSKIYESEKFGLISQLKRALVSVPSNIAEGSCRTRDSFAHFLDISKGSNAEVYTQLVLMFKLEEIVSIPTSEMKLVQNELLERNKEIGRMLSGLLRRIRKVS